MSWEEAEVGLGPIQLKALAFEVGIEGKGRVYFVPAHDEEADLINEADPAQPGALPEPQRLIVERSIDPRDLERPRGVRELQRHGQAKPMLE